MPIDRIDPNALSPEQENVDAIKKSMNKAFSENLSGLEKDMDRVERLRNSFDEIDHAFSADRITSPKDAQDVPFSTINEIAKGKPFEEQCAVISYFLANKIALSEPWTEERFQRFPESKERTEMVKAVKTYFEEQSAEDPNWEEEWNKFVSETQAYWEQKATEAYAALQATGEQIKENTEQLATDVQATAEVVWDNTVDLAQEAAELVVDGAEATCYVTTMAAIGGVRFAESCTDYVEATVLTVQGDEEAALEVVQNDVTDELIERVDEFYNPSEPLRQIGHGAVGVGEAALGMGLTIAAIACLPETATVLGSVAAADAIAATSVTLVGLNTAGNTLDHVVDNTGEVTVREITGATVAGMAIAGATLTASYVNGKIPGSVASKVAEWATTNKGITLAVGGRMTGALSSAAIAAADTGLFRVADMASDLTNVALGIEDNFDVVQELQTTLVSVGGAAVLGGVGYDIFRAARGSKLFQNIFKKPYTPDYFDYVYQSELENYAIDLVITPKEGWTEEQLAEAQAKIDALNEADLIKTPVDRGGSASAKYKVEYGPDSIPSGKDIDHTVELQLGGADDISNMNPMDSSVNRSFGSQIQNQIKDLPYGTPIKNVMFA